MKRILSIFTVILLALGSGCPSETVNYELKYYVYNQLNEGITVEFTFTNTFGATESTQVAGNSSQTATIEYVLRSGAPYRLRIRVFDETNRRLGRVVFDDIAGVYQVAVFVDDVHGVRGSLEYPL